MIDFLSPLLSLLVAHKMWTFFFGLQRNRLDSRGASRGMTWYGVAGDSEKVKPELLSVARERGVNRGLHFSIRVWEVEGDPHGPRSLHGLS